MMNIGGMLAIGLMVMMLGALCVMALQILRRQSQLANRIQNQEKNAAQQAAATASASRAHFEAMHGQIQALNKEQAQNNALIDQVYDQMHTINQVMSNTKMRGSWGEYQMEHLIRAYAGDSTAVYEVQYRLDNGKIADGAFHLPGSERVLCIDSKFPMENYLMMEDHPEEQAYYQKELSRNIKKHINDVADKYITSQTAPQALLFIPSEAVYQYICGEGSDLLHYALQKHVLLVSPTTLAGVTYTLLAAGKDYYQAQNIAQIMQELDALQKEFEALQTKMEKAERTLSGAMQAQSVLHTALNKSLKHVAQVLDGKEAQSHVPAESRFEHSEEQSESLSGPQRVTRRTGFLADL